MAGMVYTWRLVVFEPRVSSPFAFLFLPTPSDFSLCLRPSPYAFFRLHSSRGCTSTHLHPFPPPSKHKYHVAA